jgi:RNA polymerase sigma-70 factor (ECF subfamily)
MDADRERDEWLMARVAQGHRAPLEALIRRHGTPLLTFIRRMIVDAHRSEELFQEVFLAVWRKRQQYEFPRCFKSWLYAIALNRCRADFRRRPTPAQPLNSGDGEASPPDAGPSPVETMIATETAAKVTTALAQLPTQQRTVVVLRIWQGLSYAEIADLLGLTEATARSHMHHALNTLRRHLDPPV